MSLRINTIVSKLPKILLVLLLVFITGCLIKVAIWEHFYYTGIEGTERKPVEEVNVDAPEAREVDETEVTAEQVSAHVVAADKPRYLSIDKLNLKNARIREVGLTKAGALATIANIFDVGWYRASAKPGKGGTLLMDGHNGGPTKSGVFKKLNTLEIGDVITVERGDGQLFYYSVVENQDMPVEKANQYMATMQTSPVSGQESLSLITCTGEWSQSQRTYLSRTMLRAVLIED